MNRQKIFDYALNTFLLLSPIFCFRNYMPSVARGMFFIIGTFALYAISLNVVPKRAIVGLYASSFLLLALLGIFFKASIEPQQEWFNFWFSCAGFIYIFCAVLLFNTVFSCVENVHRHIKPIVFVCIINLILALAQRGGYDFMWTNSRSLCGFLETSSQLGQYSAMSLPIAFLAHPVLAVIPTATLLLSQSFSSIVASILGLTVICITGKKSARVFSILLIFIMLIYSSFNIGLIKSKWKCRPVMWQKTAKTALQKPYLGWGYDSFSKQVLGGRERNSVGAKEFSRAHNDYLHTSQELGFPIVIVFLLFISKLFKIFIKALNKDKTMLCLGASVLIALINMSGQTLIRYASIASTFIIILALFYVKLTMKETIKND